MKLIVAGLLLFHVASASAWAARLLTAIEFGAAYCFGMMQWSARQLSSDQNVLEQELQARCKGGSLPAQNAGLSDEELQGMPRRSKEEAASEHAVLEKLQQYLEPRISNLEPAALRAGKRRADADIQEIGLPDGKCDAHCAHGPDFKACLGERCGGKQLLQHLRGCRDPSWLAF